MRVVITILLAVFIPLSALMLVLSTTVVEPLANSAIAQYTNDSSEREFLVGVALGVRDFSLGNDAAAIPTGDDYRTAITSDALYHLLDVRVVFIAAELAATLALIALVILVFLLVKKQGMEVLAKPLIIGGAIPLAATALLGIAIAIDFSAFFTWMHGLFFADGTWTFPADSLLIRALPYEFWVGCAMVWAVSMAVLCVICIIVGVVFVRRKAYLDNSVSK